MTQTTNINTLLEILECDNKTVNLLNTNPQHTEIFYPFIENKSIKAVSFNNEKEILPENTSININSVIYPIFKDNDESVPVSAGYISINISKNCDIIRNIECSHKSTFYINDDINIKSTDLKEYIFPIFYMNPAIYKLTLRINLEDLDSKSIRLRYKGYFLSNDIRESLRKHKLITNEGLAIQNGMLL